MIRPKLLLCCEGVVVDQQSNNTSIFNLLEQFNFQSLPVAFPKMMILDLLERDEGDPEEWVGEIRIVLAGSEILRQVIKHNFRGQTRSRHILTLGGIPITQPGTMEVCLCKEEDVILSYTIDVKVPEGPSIVHTD